MKSSPLMLMALCICLLFVTFVEAKFPRQRPLPQNPAVTIDDTIPQTVVPICSTPPSEFVVSRRVYHSAISVGSSVPYGQLYSVTNGIGNLRQSSPIYQAPVSSYSTSPSVVLSFSPSIEAACSNGR